MYRCCDDQRIKCNRTGAKQAGWVTDKTTRESTATKAHKCRGAGGARIRCSAGGRGGPFHKLCSTSGGNRATFPPGYVGGAGGTRSLTRSQNCRSCIVGMEACRGAHHLGRLFAAQGHDGRLMSPEYVRPYVKAPKNDDRDAEGIAEAATRPTMRFVEMKTQDQIDMQTLHRSRVALINQLRAVLLDRGILVPQGKRKLEQYLVIVMNEDDGKGRSARMRMLVADIRAQWQELDRRIGEFDAEFVRWAKENEDARRR